MLSTPVAMKRLHITLLRDDAQTAAYALAELEVIHLQPQEHFGDDLQEFPAAEFHDIFYNIQSRFKKVMALDGHSSILGERESPARGEDANPSVTLEQLKLADKQLKAVWSEVSNLEEKRRQLKEQRNSIIQQQSSLQRFLSLELDLSRIGQKNRFLNVLTGTVANANTARLGKALSLTGYVINRYYSSEGRDYLIIAGSSQQGAEVNELLKTADFRELLIPPEFKNKPQMISQQLNQQQLEIDVAISHCRESLQTELDRNRNLLDEISLLLHRAMPFASLANVLKGRGQLVYFQGWVPESRQKEISEVLTNRLLHPCYLQFESPRVDEYEQVPTSLRENLLITPFQSLVGQYGLPRYAEFDPGLLFALSYTLMFGMMFGDVGHGSVILSIAIMLFKRYRVLAVVGGVAGLSSVFFGFVYGSLFGYEHILSPLWMSPMQDPQRVLLLALFWGMGFLVIANLLAIRNLVVRQQMVEAVYSPQGVIGLLFYLVAAYSLWNHFQVDSSFPVWGALILVVLMFAVLFYQWKQSTGRIIERVLVVLVEGLEFIISNLSATLSFLRVAAFSLNHVALAAAVFALAAMLDTVGHSVTIVLGNVFIIVLEGAIVAIQCLRLEYYEGFSRYFSGKGHLYEPLKFDYM